jgi:hypothetical protein
MSGWSAASRSIAEATSHTANDVAFIVAIMVTPTLKNFRVYHGYS